MQKIVTLPAYLYEWEISDWNFYVSVSLECSGYLFLSILLITMFSLTSYKQVNKMWIWIW